MSGKCNYTKVMCAKLNTSTKLIDYWKPTNILTLLKVVHESSIYKYKEIICVSKCDFILLTDYQKVAIR